VINALVIVCLGFTICTQALSQGEWHMECKDREKTSWASEEKSLAPPFTSSLYNIPASHSENYSHNFTSFSQGIFYIGAGGGVGLFNRVFAFDPFTATVHWSGDIPNSAGSIGNCPTIAGDYIIAGGQGSDAPLTCFNKSDGTVKWSKVFGNLWGRMLTVDGDKLYFVIDKLYCLNVETGSTLWDNNFTTQPKPTTPAIDDANVYISNAGSVLAYDKQTGAHIWTSEGSTNLTICVDDNNVYTSDEGKVRALKKTTGEEVWAHQIEGGSSIGLLNGMAIDDKHLVYVLQYNKDSVGAIVSIDKSTGLQKWTHAFDGRFTYPASIANGFVYIVDFETRALWGFDITNGNVASHDDSKSFSKRPVIADGALYAFVSGGGIAGYKSGASPVETVTQASDYALSVYPHPAVESSTVRFVLPNAAEISLDVYSSLGEKVAEIYSGWLDPGSHVFDMGFGLHGRVLNTGVYHVVLNVNGSVIHKNVAMIR
jgi:outer membrane protein assembly factor BamB